MKILGYLNGFFAFANYLCLLQYLTWREKQNKTK